MDLSHIDVVDFHCHVPRKCTISQYVEGGEEPREFFGMPGTHQTSLLRYLSNVYHCEPTIEEIDQIISKPIERNFNEYVRSILDRENIRLANLDFFGGKAIGELAEGMPREGRVYAEDFPRDRYVWTYGTTHIIQPSWLREHGAQDLDQGLQLIDDDLDDALSKGCRALKSMIAYYRTLRVDRVERQDAERAYKAIADASPSKLRNLYNAAMIPTYADPRLNRSLETLQDFLLRHLLIYAGEHELPFALHVASLEGSSCDQRNNDPSNLFSFFYDEEIMRTNIVILHGGYPFYDQAAVLPLQFYSMSKNVYLDLSYINYFFSPLLRNVLVSALTVAPPNRILFGSDAWPLAEREGYCTWTTKAILGDLFDELREKYKWTEADCLRVANMFLNENARKLLRI